MRDNLNSLSEKGVDNTDLVFLQGLLDSPAVTSLVKVKSFSISIDAYIFSLKLSLMNNGQSFKASIYVS